MRSTETRWVINETDANLELMSKVLGISKTMAHVMACRGIRTKSTALQFLNPALDKLHDTMTMKGAINAINRIKKAIPNEKITVYGDYDVDGIMSTVIMYKCLAALGANCSYYIPHRVEEGYGMNLNAVEKLARDGTGLILAVDNGISSVSEVNAAAAHGVDVVIIDHHEPAYAYEGDTKLDILPAAAAIVDPKQSECSYPFKENCAAGLSFKLATALYENIGVPFDLRDELLVFAAIASLCDIVILQNENRTLVSEGLKILNENKLINPGLGSLITLRGYLEKPIDAFSVGFVIGPCLNATGRLESASLAVELLLADRDDIKKRLDLSHKLEELNENRKKLTSDCVERALSLLEEDLPKIIVLIDNEAHESVVGIVAGRVRESTCRPTILLTQGDGAMKGSGRSIEAYNMFEALYAHRHLFTRFGGHTMAAGLTLPEENIAPLREALNQDCTLEEADFRPNLRIDCELSANEINLELAYELARLAPFGKGNDEPIFVSYSLYAESVRVLDEKNTLIFNFNKDGSRIKGIAFGLNKHFHEVVNKAGRRANGGFHMDVVYAVEVNVWNNVTEVQVRVKDFKIAECEASFPA